MQAKKVPKITSKLESQMLPKLGKQITKNNKTNEKIIDFDWSSQDVELVDLRYRVCRVEM